MELNTLPWCHGNADLESISLIYSSWISRYMSSSIRIKLLGSYLTELFVLPVCAQIEQNEQLGEDKTNVFSKIN
jgi:hypothetical protein